MLQGLQLMLSNLRSAEDSLKTLSAQLNDSVAAEELNKLISHHNSTSAEVDASNYKNNFTLQLTVGTAG